MTFHGINLIDGYRMFSVREYDIACFIFIINM